MSQSTYGFIAKDTVGQVVSVTNAADVEMLFNDDLTSPLYDNGNDFYINQYIVPDDGLEQKFILEGLDFTTNAFGGGSRIFTFKIVKNGGTILAQFSTPGLSQSTNYKIPSIVTPYGTHAEGDIIKPVVISDNVVNTDLTFATGGKFSNSFKN